MVQSPYPNTNDPYAGSANFSQPDNTDQRANPGAGINGVDASRSGWRSWGGYGAGTDANGNPMPGTSTFDTDVARYGQMGAAVNPNGAPIDRTQSNESRGLSMDALGLLRDRATGGYTAAQGLARNQALGAVDGIQSGAASIKGGAGARAAAARGATATGARVWAQAAQDRQALGAREQADAAGQYFGAASTQRGEDLGLATDQAKLQAQQNALNENHDQFYQQQQYATKKAQADNQLGRTGAEIAQSAAASAQAQQAHNAAYQTTKDNIGTTASLTSGAFAAAHPPTPAPAAAPAVTPPFDPNDPNHTGSDERMKDDVHPVGHDKGYRKTPRERLHANVASYDGKYLAPPLAAAKEAPKAAQSLDDAMSSYGEDAAPYARPEPDHTAAGRAGQPGAMFGAKAAPIASYQEQLWGPGGKSSASDQAFFGAGNQGEAGRRDIAMSDPRTKDDAERFGKDAGEKVAHRAELEAKGQKLLEAGTVAVVGPPSQMHDLIGTAGAGASEAYDASARAVPALRKKVEGGLAETTHRVADVAKAVTGNANRSTTTSDPRAKTDVHGDPMAAANRSMAPSSYEYKPEFTPPDQQPGEKNVGPMANAMDADPIAKTAIVKDPQTGLLAIDKTKGLKLVMGGLSALQQQVDKLQSRRVAK